MSFKAKNLNKKENITLGGKFESQNNLNNCFKSSSNKNENGSTFLRNYHTKDSFLHSDVAHKAIKCYKKGQTL